MYAVNVLHHSYLLTLPNAVALIQTDLSRMNKSIVEFMRYDVFEAADGVEILGQDA